MRWRRLPRSRGDRPPLTDSDLIALAGSPAHAGIDRKWSSLARACVRLPRSRGDRPLFSILCRAQMEAPPLTRGSTPRSRLPLSGTRGSPAHAGIDPTFASRVTTRDGLPRSRGDRPGFALDPVAQWPAPPLTRGSTVQGREHVAAVVGSPAHAGIDPLSVPLTGSLPRLPRSRGDRPLAILLAHSIHPAPPLTRGSTKRARSRERSTEGCSRGVGPLSGGPWTRHRKRR